MRAHEMLCIKFFFKLMFFISNFFTLGDFGKFNANSLPLGTIGPKVRGYIS